MSRILVVDDEPDLCEILRFDLETEGFEVEVAYSAEEALGLVEGQGRSFDLLLLDVMMERMSGFDLAEHLRSRGVQTPIIFLTASDDYPQAFATGADDFIRKPFALDNVVLRLRAVLRRAGGASQQAEAVADSGLRLVPEKAEAWLGERRLDLTRREFDILRLLYSARGRYFSRADILAAVWPDDTLVTDRSVDVHIARLRKKLGPDGPRIDNKIGIGYGIF